MKKDGRRGSSLVFVIMIIVSMTAIILMSARIATVGEARYQREYKRLVADGLHNSIVETSKSMATAQLLVPGTAVVPFAGHNINATVVNNDATMRRTYLVSTSVTVGGQQFSKTSILAGRQPAHPIYYALFSDQDITGTAGFDGLSSDNAAVHANQSISISGSTTVQGDVTYVSGNNLASDAQVSTQSAIPFENPVWLTLWLAPGTSIVSDTLSGHTFTPSATVNDEYEMLRRGGDLKLMGDFAGKGTIVVNGDLDVIGNVRYANLGSQLVVIVLGNVRVAHNVNQLDGTYYATGNFELDVTNGPGPLTMSRGNLICGGNLRLDSRKLVMTVDRTFWNNRTEAWKHYVPGFWPFALRPGLMR